MDTNAIKSSSAAEQMGHEVAVHSAISYPTEATATSSLFHRGGRVGVRFRVPPGVAVGRSMNN